MNKEEQEKIVKDWAKKHNWEVIIHNRNPAVLSDLLDLVKKTWAEAEKEIENAYEEGIDGINNRTAVIEDWKHFCEEKDKEIKELTKFGKLKEISDEELLNFMSSNDYAPIDKVNMVKLQAGKTEKDIVDKVEKIIENLKKELTFIFTEYDGLEVNKRNPSKKVIEELIDKSLEEIKGLK